VPIATRQLQTVEGKKNASLLWIHHWILLFSWEAHQLADGIDCVMLGYQCQLNIVAAAASFHLARGNAAAFEHQATGNWQSAVRSRHICSSCASFKAL